MKVSVFNIVEHNTKNTIVYNSRTGNCIVFPNDKTEDYNNCSFYTEKCYSQGFYVDDEIDEFTDLIKKSVEILNKQDFLKLRILTTTGCNARCPYCYEQGTKVMHMTIETAKNIISFILKRYDDRKKYVEIEWFGGEPLLNTKVIDYICEGLKAEGINYYSSMVSNGYLINDVIIEKMLSSWNLKKIQITLDGRKKEYERIKGLGVNSYEKVISSIKSLSENKIKVDLRLNFNKANLNEIKLLIDKLSTYNFNKFVEVYVAKLFDYNKSDVFTLEDEMIELYQELHERKLLTKLKLLPRNLDTGCMAYYPNFFTVDPDGRLFKCDRKLLDKNSLALVGDEVKDLPSFSYGSFSLKCKKCSIFPTCWCGCLYERNNGENTCYMTERIYKERLRMVLQDYEEGAH